MHPPEHKRLAPWAEDDEVKLEDFKKSKVEIKGTALGRREALKRRELKAAITTVP